MVNDYIRNNFIVLYKTYARNKEDLDEIILFSFSEITNLDIERSEEENYYKKRKGEDLIIIPETKLLKRRIALRKFKKYNLINDERARVYYWSNKLGAHLMKPFWKKKDGVFTFDDNEMIDEARKLAIDEGAFYNNSELDNYLANLNNINIHYHFEKNGYYNNADENGGDWATSELSIHFNEGSFFIEDYKIVKFFVASHWQIEEAWEKAESMLKVKKWSNKELADLIKIFDSYDTFLSLTYYDKEELYVKSLRMDGGQIKGYEKDNWPAELVEVIDAINNEYTKKGEKS